MQNLRVVFAGTPEAAVPSLERLAASAHEIVAVVTRPPAPLGRKRVLTPSPVAQAAEGLGIPVIEAARLDDDVTARIRDLAPDLGVIVAYGGLVREPLLSGPRLGWINLHFSLLPSWRGAAPVQRSLMAGESRTGAAVFQLVPELDAGDVYASIERDIDGATAGFMLGALADDGAALLHGVVDALAAGTAVATPQQGEPSFAPKLTIDDARLDWSHSATAVDARLRGVTPEPGAFTEVGDVRVKIHAAALVVDVPGELADLGPGEIRLNGRAVYIGTGDGVLELHTVQPAGRSTMRASDWVRGLNGEVVAR